VLHDYFVGYPVGTPNIKPPLLDYLFSLTSIILGLGSPSARLVETVAAVSAPLVGGLTVIAIFFLARRLFGREVAFLSALLIAFMPAHMSFTMIGRPDNEMIEPLMVSLMFLAYWRLQDPPEDRGAALRSALAMAAAAGLALLFWRGATLWIGLFALGAVADVTLDFRQGRSVSKRGGTRALAFLILALFLSLLCVVNPFGNMRGFAFNALSWFHALLFGAVAIGLYLYGRLCRFWLDRGWGLLAFSTVVVLCLGAVAAASLAFEPLRRNLTGGLRMAGLVAPGPWVESIVEYKPLFSGSFEGSVAAFAEMFGWGVVLLPLLIVFLCYELSRDGIHRGKLLFAISAALVLALSVSSRRFIHVLAIFAAISSGWLIHRYYRSILSMRWFARPGHQRVAAWVLSAALSAILFHPLAIMTFRASNTTVGNPVRRVVMNTMIWIRDNTPSPGDVYRPGLMPTYSVMANWNFASWINYIAERPSVSTDYGHETYGLRESAAFLTATEEEEANALLASSGARYVLVDDLGGLARVFADIAERPEVDYTRPEEYLSLVSMRLFWADGIPTRFRAVQVQGLDRYRLVYESRKVGPIRLPSGKISLLKVFEHLPGARARVEARPGSIVTATATIRTNRLREFEFEKRAVADAAGTATLVLPYARPVGEGSVGLATPYRIRTEDGATDLWLTEQEVIGGRRVTVPVP
jgi:dolichyl-diphosphooligosaccharide--protein glycosyltransferase